MGDEHLVEEVRIERDDPRPFRVVAPTAAGIEPKRTRSPRQPREPDPTEKAEKECLRSLLSLAELLRQELARERAKLETARLAIRLIEDPTLLDRLEKEGA